MTGATNDQQLQELITDIRDLLDAGWEQGDFFVIPLGKVQDFTNEYEAVLEVRN